MPLLAGSTFVLALVAVVSIAAQVVPIRRTPDLTAGPMRGITELGVNVCHHSRHSFATEAMRRGMNPVRLAQRLGHTGLRMTELVYAHLNAVDGYDAVMRMLTSDQ
ncbi:MAG TPA: tyrosine-type recombinase/integrase [Candidatus Nanopelagicaceae bacterium]|nr:tyrosine-type recombinase/integrase [Candidatus Nanopelagicaceae bacterium]